LINCSNKLQLADESLRGLPKRWLVKAGVVGNQASIGLVSLGPGKLHLGKALADERIHYPDAYTSLVQVSGSTQVVRTPGFHQAVSIPG